MGMSVDLKVGECVIANFVDASGAPQELRVTLGKYASGSSRARVVITAPASVAMIPPNRQEAVAEVH